MFMSPPPLHPHLEAITHCLAKSPVHPLEHPLFLEKKLKVYVKRDDFLHPVISGNKWRKLKYIVNDALENRAKTLVSMGGAWSNHLHALAFIGQQIGLDTVGLVRNPHTDQDTPSMQDMRQWGMNLQLLSRDEFRQLRTDHKPYLTDHNVYWIAEGGTSQLAINGVADIIDELKIDDPTRTFDLIVLACGTGTTLAGLIAGLARQLTSDQTIQPHLLGFAALKGADFLTHDVRQLLLRSGIADNAANWSINLDSHYGGFGKIPVELRQFMQAFTAETELPLDPVYTGKLMAGLCDQIKQGVFKPGTRMLVLHTGGLQGSRCK